MSEARFDSTGPLRPIVDVAADLGIAREHLTLYGEQIAKIAPAAAADAAERGRPRGKLILVSAITPTDAGEGKTTTSIGLAQGLARIGERACAVLREPSLGPTFGLKGGATGGGRARLEPSADINLHFTCTSPATSTRSRRRTTCSPRCSTTTSTTATRCAWTRGACRGGA
jgi:formate--tetrahydrofolate ligase